MRWVGDHFEAKAARWLQEQGWRLVARNFNTPLGELDIVALHGNSLVFVEVKARSHRGYAGAAAAVGRNKQQKLVRTARAFLRQHPELQQYPCRFDVIAFEPRQSGDGHRLNWIRSAFGS